MGVHAIVGIGAGLDSEEVRDVLRLAILDPVLEAEGLGISGPVGDDGCEAVTDL